jgi:hypothetical protein
MIQSANTTTPTRMLPAKLPARKETRRREQTRSTAPHHDYSRGVEKARRHREPVCQSDEDHERRERRDVWHGRMLRYRMAPITFGHRPDCDKSPSRAPDHEEAVRAKSAPPEQLRVRSSSCHGRIGYWSKRNKAARAAISTARTASCQGTYFVRSTGQTTARALRERLLRHRRWAIGAHANSGRTKRLRWLDSEGALP